ncbi:MAG: hypothetical protein ACI38U_07765 [Corynebacterium sp.]|uniref:hypothetical protein n=1 Tax=Corynebacterium sp. TaxID=1720 RepID=UPI003F00E384
MARHDLYKELKLDRSKAPADLAAELDDRLRGVSWEDKATHEQLTVARKILGDPTKRTMYDQRLDDPSASIDIDNLRGLANQEAAAPKTSTMTAAMAVEKVKGFYRADQKPKLVGTAVAAVAVLGLVGAGVASCGSDDEDAVATSGSTSSNSDSGGSASNNGSSTGSSQEDGLSEYEFLEPGEELVVTTGKPYEYDDGRTEYVNGGEYGYTVDNMRLVDRMSVPDPDAPDDHPDSKAEKIGEFVCFDVTVRVIEGAELPDYLLDDSTASEAAEDELLTQVNRARELKYTQVNPILDGRRLGEKLNDSVVVDTPPGSDGELVVSPETKTTYPGLASSTPGDVVVANTDENTVTHGMCLSASRSETDEPERNTGYVVNAEVNPNNAGADREVRGWRFDH